MVMICGLRYKPLSNKTLLATYRNTISEITYTANLLLSCSQRRIRKWIKRIIRKNIPLQIHYKMAHTHGRHSKLIGLIIATIASKKLLQRAKKVYYSFRNSTTEKILSLSPLIQILVYYMVYFIFCDYCKHINRLKNLILFHLPRLKLRLLNHWDNLTDSRKRLCRYFNLELAYTSWLY